MSCWHDRASLRVAIGPEPLLEMLAPLRNEHLQRGESLLIPSNGRALRELTAELPGDAATVLVLEDPTEPSLRGTFATPLIRNAGGVDTVLGWLRLDARELSAYAGRAAALLRRPELPALPIAFLGPREQRYLELLEQIAQMADTAPALVPFRWNAERLARHRLVEALHQGAAAAIYAGHGNARGYFAYGGITAGELTEGPAPGADESLGVLFSLACRTGQPVAASGRGASHPSRGLADAVVAAGVASAVLAPIGDPLHEDNRALSVALIRALASGARSCADIVHTVRASGAPLDGYVIIGDPVVPVAATPDAMERCGRIFAPAPDALLSGP